MTTILNPVTYIPDPEGNDFRINTPGTPRHWADEYPAEAVYAMLYEDTPITVPETGTCGYHSYWGGGRGHGRFAIQPSSRTEAIVSVSAVIFWRPQTFLGQLLRIWTNGTGYDTSGSGSDWTTATGWSAHKHTWTTNPATGLGWTPAEVAALNIGTWMGWSGEGPFFDRLYAEIDYGYRTTYVETVQDARGRPIFKAECKCYTYAGVLIETQYSDNGIATFTKIPVDEPVYIESRWGKHYQRTDNIFISGADDIVTMVTKSHTQNTDDYTKGVKVTTEPATPPEGRWYVG